MGTEEKGLITLNELNLKIDPEFQGKIPPLTEAEFKQLEENILTAGEVYEPIAVWNGTIVDGHNRYKIIQAHPDIKWRTREIQFENKWAAFDWMYKNQLGRRNLTDEQRRYLLGKLYEARKHTLGGDRRSDEFSAAEFRPLKMTRDGVSKVIAEEQHVGKTHVKDSYQYSKGIDAIRNEEPELAESILKAETKIPKGTIQDIGQAKPEERPEMIKAVKDGKPYQPKPKETKEVKKESEEEKQKRREEMMAIREVKEKLFSAPVQIEYTIDSLLHDIEINASPFIRLFRQIAEENKKVCASNKETVIKALHENITMKIEELEKEIENYEL